MIINIRGTSGSGKSILVRRLMRQYDRVEPVKAEKRRQPLGYRCTRAAGKALFVVGHYETPCGGADTISMKGALDYIYNLVRSHHETDVCDVIVEGLIVESDVNRCAQLHADGIPLIVIALNTPIEECLASAQTRRDARGDTRPFDHTNTVNRVTQIERRVQRLRAAQVNAIWQTRQEAFETITTALDLPRADGEWWPPPREKAARATPAPLPVPALPPGTQYNLFS